MGNFEAQVFDIEVGGRPYVVEFCREGIKAADDLGVFNNDASILTKRPALMLYAGLKMHKPDITPNLAEKIWSNMQDEGYTVKEFNESIGDEFTRCFNAFFLEGGKKKILPRNLKVAASK
jgi:hypothetical protein